MEEHDNGLYRLRVHRLQHARGRFQAWHFSMEIAAMSDTIRRIGILTGGGDCPGLKVVIRAVVKTAINAHGWEV